MTILTFPYLKRDNWPEVTFPPTGKKYVDGTWWGILTTTSKTK